MLFIFKYIEQQISASTILLVIEDAYMFIFKYIEQQISASTILLVIEDSLYVHIQI